MSQELDSEIPIIQSISAKEDGNKALKVKRTNRNTSLSKKVKKKIFFSI